MCFVSAHAQTVNKYLHKQNIFYSNIIFKEHFSMIENLCADTGIIFLLIPVYKAHKKHLKNNVFVINMTDYHIYNHKCIIHDT